jgi:monofunctional biosynthetic peptidoglycan transglycosylase
VAGSKRSGCLWKLLLCFLAFAFAIYCAFAILIVSLKWIDPPTTSVQMQRRMEAWREHKPYSKRYTFVRTNRISRELQHAVVAAEDTRFSEHSGIDWIEMQKVLEQDLERGKLGRGGSTISQQLVKNLFLTTKRSLVRKGLEFTLVPMVEFALGKDRILELYLNVIEWGPGVYGAEAASRYWYNVPAAQVGREQAARLASVIPNPRRRRPDRMDGYASVILTRMRQLGW